MRAFQRPLLPEGYLSERRKVVNFCRGEHLSTFQSINVARKRPQFATNTASMSAPPPSLC